MFDKVVSNDICNNLIESSNSLSGEGKKLSIALPWWRNLQLNRNVENIPLSSQNNFSEDTTCQNFIGFA